MARITTTTGNALPLCHWRRLTLLRDALRDGHRTLFIFMIGKQLWLPLTFAHGTLTPQSPSPSITLHFRYSSHLASFHICSYQIGFATSIALNILVIFAFSRP